MTKHNVSVIVKRGSAQLIARLESSLSSSFSFQSFDPEAKNLLDIVRESEVVITEPGIFAPLLLANGSSFPQLKWLHSTFAGVNALAKVSDKMGSTVCTKTRGYGSTISEYCLTQLVAMERGFYKLYESKKIHQWETEAESFRPLQDLTLGILGFGDIGKDLARKAYHGFGMKVVAMNSTGVAEDPNVKVYSSDNVQEMLASVDVVVNALPSTARTAGFLNGKLCHCTKKPWFINIGRGDVITEAELLKALDAGYIRGAALDVFETEPLHKESLLWDHPDVIITPHCSGPCFDDVICDSFILNATNYLEGKPFANAVDWSRGY